MNNTSKSGREIYSVREDETDIGQQVSHPFLDLW